MNEKLFVCGEIFDLEVRKKLLGNSFEEDSLKGYKKIVLRIKGEIFSVFEKSRNRFDFVFGKVFEISEEDLKKLDEYSKDECRRVGAGLEIYFPVASF